MECIYLQSSARFKEEGARSCTDIFTADAAGNIKINGKNELFTVFTTNDIDRHINELQTYAKANKLHLSGAFVIAVYNDGIEYQVVHVSNSTMKKDDVDAKISTSKTDKPKKKKSLTVDEKLALIKDFYKEHSSFPKPSDTHKGFKIGIFWANLEKNKDVYERIKREVE